VPNGIIARLFWQGKTITIIVVYIMLKKILIALVVLAGGVHAGDIWYAIYRDTTGTNPHQDSILTSVYNGSGRANWITEAEYKWALEYILKSEGE
jgi:hypothetical protein